MWGGNSEICYNGKNGWVVDDWEELIKILNNLPNITNEEYRHMCEKSREIYRENFRFETFREKYLRLLRNL